jgi:ABC-type phosphonate transport system ATPase subunit
LLEHINLGACRPEDLPSAFTAGMEELLNYTARLVLKKQASILYKKLTVRLA